MDVCSMYGCSGIEAHATLVVRYWEYQQGLCVAMYIQVSPVCMYKKTISCMYIHPIINGWSV